MLDFMIELERVLKIWPDNVKWNLVQIAEYTNTKVHFVVEGLSEVLNKSLDVHEPLSYNEVAKAHALLMEKNRGALETRRRDEMQAIEKAIDGFDKTMEKVRVMQASKNWRGAYRTLSYFYGNQKERLPTEIIVSICDECLRLGAKGDANFQEMSQWLRIGIQALINSPNREVIEDALDLIDAYGDYFTAAPQGKGEQFLTNIFLALKPAAMEFNLTPRFNDVANGLNLTRVLDVVS